MKLKTIVVSLATLAILAGSYILIFPPSAEALPPPDRALPSSAKVALAFLPPYCDEYCTPSTSCSAVCYDWEAGRSTTCGAWGICAYPTPTPTPTPPPNSCTINLVNNTHNCGSISAITFIVPPANNKTVFKVNLAPSTGYHGIRFSVNYTSQPTGWTVNIGDSQSNNGAGGDAANQSNDAETQVWGTTLSAYGNDYTQGERLLLNWTNFVSAGSTGLIEVKDRYLGWGPNFGNYMNSPYLYALAGEADNEGPVNYDIYAAFNRVIYDYPSDRTGTGVGSVNVTLLP